MRFDLSSALKSSFRSLKTHFYRLWNRACAIFSLVYVRQYNTDAITDITGMFLRTKENYLSTCRLAQSHVGETECNSFSLASATAALPEHSHSVELVTVYIYTGAALRKTERSFLCISKICPCFMNSRKHSDMHERLAAAMTYWLSCRSCFLPVAVKP